MIKHIVEIRPRYNEVDQMGYVYHSNYLNYCHIARTELMREIGIPDNFLEERNIMMPVISFGIDYKKPAKYDELLTVETVVKEVPSVRFKFEFIIRNSEGLTLSIAKSTVVFVNKDNRLPIPTPDFVKEALLESIT